MAIRLDLHRSRSAPSVSMLVSGNSVQRLENKCTEKCHLMLYSLCLIASSLAQGRFFSNPVYAQGSGRREPLSELPNPV